MVRAKSSQESKPRRRNSVKRPAQEAVAASDGKEEEKIDGERKEKKPRRSTSSSSSRITRQRTNSSRSSRKLVKSPGQEGTVSNGKEELGLDGERKKKPRVDDDKIHCDICLDFKTDDQIFKIDSCGHVFCNYCIGKHVEAKLQDNKHTIVCPSVNCEAVIEFGTCNSIVPEIVLEKWDKLLCESSIPASETYYCPFKDCSAMLLRDTNEVIREPECPSCHRLFCARCSAPWHPSIDCEESKEDGLVKKLPDDKKWKRCPNCQYYVEREGGCPHMTCRCTFQFCYACGETWTAVHDSQCTSRGTSTRDRDVPPRRTIRVRTNSIPRRCLAVRIS